MLTKNKKKIRGWKRRIKELDRWFEHYRSVDLEIFLTRGEVYMKIQIDPWNRLAERSIPPWYFKHILSRLLQVHDAWKVAFEKSGVAYDLQVWLNDPKTHRSQLVCARVDRAGETLRNYYRKSKEQKDFPYEKWESTQYNLSDFDWELYDDEIFLFKDLDELTEDDIKEISKNGFREDKIVLHGQEEIQYSKKAGDVWIGRLSLASKK